MESHVYLSTQSKVCLSIQRALLDKVTSNLRRVSFQLVDHLISLYFYYSDEPSETERELANDAEAEVIADFPKEYTIEIELSAVLFPLKINSYGRIIYNRFEEL